MTVFDQMTLLDKKSHPAVNTYIDMLQSVITRMAKNSAACKSWAIPLVTAILLLALEKGIVPTKTAYIPLCLFYLLDCYYLGLESKLTLSISSTKAKMSVWISTSSTEMMIRVGS